MKIGYQGIEASNSEEASHIFGKKFDNDVIEYVPLVDSYNVVKALVNREIDFGVMAIYNAIAGTVEETKIALEGVNLEKILEIKLPIHHCVFKNKNTDLSNIKIVASHIQALEQTKNNIKKLFTNCTKMEVEDTALSAKKLANNEIDANTVVICRKNAGEMYNLELVYENIEDEKNNITTFGIYKLK